MNSVRIETGRALTVRAASNLVGRVYVDDEPKCWETGEYYIIAQSEVETTPSESDFKFECVALTDSPYGGWTFKKITVYGGDVVYEGRLAEPDGSDAVYVPLRMKEALTRL